MLGSINIICCASSILFDFVRLSVRRCCCCFFLFLCSFFSFLTGVGQWPWYWCTALPIRCIHVFSNIFFNLQRLGVYTAPFTLSPLSFASIFVWERKTKQVPGRKESDIDIKIGSEWARDLGYFHSLNLIFYCFLAVILSFSTCISFRLVSFAPVPVLLNARFVFSCFGRNVSRTDEKRRSSEWNGTERRRERERERQWRRRKKEHQLMSTYISLFAVRFGRVCQSSKW